MDHRTTNELAGKAINDPAFAESIEHVTDQRHQHGEAPGRFLSRIGAARIRWNWGDGARRAFRGLLQLIYAEIPSRQGGTAGAPPARRKTDGSGDEPPSRTSGWLS